MLTGAVAKGGRLATLQEQVAVARLNPFNYEYNKQMQYPEIYVCTTN